MSDLAILCKFANTCTSTSTQFRCIVTVTINEGAYKAITLFFFKCDMKISAAYILFISTSITQAYYC